VHRRLINSVLETGGVVPVVSKPAIEMFPEYIKEFEGDPHAEILLFLGCIINIFQKIPEVELVKVPKSGYCCGGGGGVRAAFPNLADKLAIRRIEIAKEFGTDILITNCSFCILSFERVLNLKEEAGERMGFRIIDFYELFSEAYGNSKSSGKLRGGNDGNILRPAHSRFFEKTTLHRKNA
jgi:hypothetical protein